MSRIGNKPINLDDVTVIVENSKIIVEGKKGKLNIDLLAGIEVQVNEETLIVSRKNDQKQTKAYHGLIRSLLYNAVEGVSKGYSYNMFLQGIGYRVQKKRK